MRARTHTTNRMNHATYNASNKTFSLTSSDVARAMIFQGNPYGHNRGKGFKTEAAARSAMLALGFKEIK